MGLSSSLPVDDLRFVVDWEKALAKEFEASNEVETFMKLLLSEGCTAEHELAILLRTEYCTLKDLREAIQNTTNALSVFVNHEEGWDAFYNSGLETFELKNLDNDLYMWCWPKCSKTLAKYDWVFGDAAPKTAEGVSKLMANLFDDVMKEWSALCLLMDSKKDEKQEDVHLFTISAGTDKEYEYSDLRILWRLKDREKEHWKESKGVTLSTGFHSLDDMDHDVDNKLTLATLDDERTMVHHFTQQVSCAVDLNELCAHIEAHEFEPPLHPSFLTDLLERQDYGFEKRLDLFFQKATCLHTMICLFMLQFLPYHDEACRKKIKLVRFNCLRKGSTVTVPTFLPLMGERRQLLLSRVLSDWHQHDLVRNPNFFHSYLFAVSNKHLLPFFLLRAKDFFEAIDFKNYPQSSAKITKLQHFSINFFQSLHPHLLAYMALVWKDQYPSILEVTMLRLRELKRDLPRKPQRLPVVAALNTIELLAQFIMATMPTDTVLEQLCRNLAVVQTKMTTVADNLSMEQFMNDLKSKAFAIDSISPEQAKELVNYFSKELFDHLRQYPQYDVEHFGMFPYFLRPYEVRSILDRENTTA